MEEAYEKTLELIADKKPPEMPQELITGYHVVVDVLIPATCDDIGVVKAQVTEALKPILDMATPQHTIKRGYIVLGGMVKDGER
jgi:hypothetical protein